MNDGLTRKIQAPEAGEAGHFHASHRICLVMLSGPGAGTEYPVSRSVVRIGRGPGVDIAIADGSVSQQHALLEVSDSGVRIRDLQSTNGVHVNGAAVELSDLKHGDRVQLGECHLQLVIEERPKPTRSYDLSSDG